MVSPELWDTTQGRFLKTKRQPWNLIWPQLCVRNYRNTAERRRVNKTTFWQTGKQTCEKYEKICFFITFLYRESYVDLLWCLSSRQSASRPFFHFTAPIFQTPARLPSRRLQCACCSAWALRIPPVSARHNTLSGAGKHWDTLVCSHPIKSWRASGSFYHRQATPASKLRPLPVDAFQNKMLQMQPIDTNALVLFNHICIVSSATVARVLLMSGQDIDNIVM